MQEFFRQIAAAIHEKRFDQLPDIPVIRPEYFNWVTEIFEGLHTAEHPQKTALLWTDGSETVRYTYRQLSEQCNQLLNFLRSKDVGQGDIVLTQLMLQPINWTAILATIKGGMQLIPTATIMGVPDMAYRFEKTLPKVVISDAANAHKTDEAEQAIGQQIAVKIICEGTREGWYSLEDIQTQPVVAEGALTKPDDTLFMFFTSGTTGMPKVVCHTHFSYPVGHLTTASWIGLTRDDLHYNISQPGWAKFAWSSFFAPWSVGATIFAHHTANRFDAATTLALIEQHKITTLCAPPTVLRLFIQENVSAFRFSLRECVAAGEPLNPEIIEEWKAATGLLIRDGFGQTESTCMVGNLPGGAVRFGSMGKPTFLYDVVIADDNGNELPDNEEGNICVRTTGKKASGIFAGYLNDEERQAKVFKHGLYYTGDKAYRDSDGYIWFIGRDDDVIKASDYRIGPFEVESVLLEHESVVESAVVGSPHPIKGFEVKAFVVPHPDFDASEQTAEALFVFCKDHLSPYKMPRIIEFVEELPKTISGKIRRVELRAAEAENKARKIKSGFEYFYTKK